MQVVVYRHRLLLPRGSEHRRDRTVDFFGGCWEETTVSSGSLDYRSILQRSNFLSGGMVIHSVWVPVLGESPHFLIEDQSSLDLLPLDPSQRRVQGPMDDIVRLSSPLKSGQCDDKRLSKCNSTLWNGERKACHIISTTEIHAKSVEKFARQYATVPRNSGLLVSDYRIAISYQWYHPRPCR